MDYSVSVVSQLNDQYKDQLTTCETVVSPSLVPQSSNYNIPSTFIDMESLCVYQDQTASKPTLSFNRFSSNSYPGTIASFHPEASSSVSNYFPYSTPDKNVTNSPYPWPLPNQSDNPPFSK